MIYLSVLVYLLTLSGCTTSKNDSDNNKKNSEEEQPSEENNKQIDVRTSDLENDIKK
jgi:outer membrane biogenesis lipoprotein LolB